MALNQMLQTIAKSLAEDSIRCLAIQEHLRDACENGPWRYSSDEVAEMWSELTERMEDLQRRISATNAVYDPSVADAIFAEMWSLTSDGVT